MSKSVIVPGEASETDSEDELKLNSINLMTTSVQGAVITGEDSESDTEPDKSVASAISALTQKQILDDSLFHQKLREQNEQLSSNLESFCQNVVDDNNKQLNAIDQQLLRSQVTLQNAVTSLKTLRSLDNVLPGDCIVCFSKNDIYSVSRGIEATGKEVAVIYGGLPPGTKLAQAAKFNDPDNSCKILVATDAIGMGLNLSIKRVVFYSLIKPSMNEKGEREMDTISVSAALQIAGRAGRFV